MISATYLSKAFDMTDHIPPPACPLPADFLLRPVAHRAYHDQMAGRPENSRTAVQAAIEAGYAIEIDLQISSDGVAMVFHDYDLDRLTRATGLVRERTAAELGALPLMDTTEGIPTLAEILALVAGRVPLLIEIKYQVPPVGTGPLERAVAANLADYAGPVAVMSFDPAVMAEMGRLMPHIPRGLTTGTFDPDSYAPMPPDLCARLRDIPDYTDVGASFISHSWSDLTRDRVSALKQAGAKILCWTIKSPEAEFKARQVADNITFEGYAAPFPAT